jgi:1,2-diacylglycerol 3-beta-galactosyltransferase
MAKVSAPFVGKKLQALIREKKPDIIVSVHPMTNHIALAAMKEINHNVPLITVVTDPVSFHRVWISPLADKIVLATEDAKTLCIKYGYGIDNIEVLGFPVEPKFLKISASKKELRQSMGFATDKFTLLFMGGGEGGGNIYEHIVALSRGNLDIQVIVAAGRNQSLRKKLERNSSKFSFPVKVFAFTDKVSDIMGASDIVITKAGPGTITEAVSKNLPIILTSYLPGQEKGNVEYVLKMQLGVMATDRKRIVAAVHSIMQPATYSRHVSALQKENNPEAVYNIAKRILDYNCK